MADTDATADVYELAPDGTARLLSPGGTGAVTLERVSADGYVAMITPAALLAADTDGGGNDMYVAAPDGSLRLASGGSSPTASISIFVMDPDGAVASSRRSRSIPPMARAARRTTTSTCGPPAASCGC